MLMGKYWAICEATCYKVFIPSLKPVAYLSSELFESLVFPKPNLCDLIVKNAQSKLVEKYEFYVLPSDNNEKKGDIFYDTHVVSLPEKIYHELMGFSQTQLLSVRTDIF